MAVFILSVGLPIFSIFTFLDNSNREANTATRTWELAYTTVQTMLNVLLRKGKVKRKLSDKAYFYRPVVSRSQVVSQTIEDLINRLFGGSAENLVMSMVEAEHLTADDLSRLNAIIEKEAEDGGAQ